MSKILDLTTLSLRVRATIFRTESRGFCQSCQKSVSLMLIEQTAEFYKTNIEDINSLQQKTILHPIHNNRGKLMICADSLFTFFEQRQTQLLDATFISALSLTAR